jgi:hypothetical protein
MYQSRAERRKTSTDRDNVSESCAVMNHSLGAREPPRYYHGFHDSFRYVFKTGNSSQLVRVY